LKKFEVIEHTADIGIVAYGADLKEAFANAACAMFSLMADLERVEERIRWQIEVKAEDGESLVVSWLNELLYLLDVERIVFRRFEVAELSDTRLKGAGYGEKLDTERHCLKGGIKAATYHMLRVAPDDEGCSIRVIFDV
jgi:SHS2 domain-containing protein